MKTQTNSRNGSSPGGGSPRRFSAEEVALLRRTLMRPENGNGRRDPYEHEVELFVRECERRGLDPFTRQLYARYRWSNRAWKPDGRSRGDFALSIETSIDGLRLIAERTGKYEGQTPVFWCGSDGAWRECWPEGTPPVAAKVGVHRAGAREPTWATAHFAEYAEVDDAGRPTGFYARMPRNQIGKCAEALALRKTFPEELSGLYTAEELGVELETGEPGTGRAAAQARAAQDEAAEVPQVPARAEATQPAGQGHGDGASTSPADRATRRALREAIERAGLDGEGVAALAHLLYGQRSSDRLSEEQLRDLADLLDAAALGAIEAEALTARVAEAAHSEEREAARARFRRWVIERANAALAARPDDAEAPTASKPTAKPEANGRRR